MPEEYKVYLKKFKIAVNIFVGAIAVFGFLLFKVVPEVQRILSIQEQQKAQSAVLNDAEQKLQSLKDSAEVRKIENENMVKVFFKPISGGNDTESVISDEFGEILQLMRDNKIKTRSIKYDYDPQDDNFVQHVGYKYHVCKITAEMIGNYSSFECFLRELYKHEHFLDIAKLEIVPYERNKRILLVNLEIKLYAERDPATIVIPEPQPQEQESAEQPMDIAPETPVE